MPSPGVGGPVAFDQTSCWSCWRSLETVPSNKGRPQCRIIVGRGTQKGMPHLPKVFMAPSHNAVKVSRSVVGRTFWDVLEPQVVSGFPPKRRRTKMAVDLSVARRQLGEALGDHSQTYGRSFLCFCNVALTKISSTFFLFVF